MKTDQCWAATAIDSCVRRGIDHFFLAPGSRCTPLTLAVAHHPHAIFHQHFDERGLAFATLGYARATGKPGVFICTSGTAVANAMPAVVEASNDNVPMLLMTADRPPELRGVGANQAIDQVHIFGRYTRWFVDMPCPDDAIPLNFVRSQVGHGIAQSRGGPSHLNWMFREPFGTAEHVDVRFPQGPRVAPVTVREPSSTSIACSGRTLMVLGGCHPREAQSARRLADRYGIFVITDVTSGQRCGSPELPAQFELPAPDTVIHVGSRLVSKAWLRYTESLSNAQMVRLTNHESRIDPNHAGISCLVESLDQIDESVRLSWKTDATEANELFRNAWAHAHQARRRAIGEGMQVLGDELIEPKIAFTLAANLPTGSGLFLGNSTPVRDVDWFADWSSKSDLHVVANRGASGIDGTLASAAGFAMGTGKPVTVLAGDLAALHDLNSLAMLRDVNSPVIVVIINNHGGGIFDMLPIANQSQHFEQFFATPHTLSFEDVSRMFSLDYHRPVDLLSFQSVFEASFAQPGATIIELVTDRQRNFKARQQLNAAIQ